MSVAHYPVFDALPMWDGTAAPAQRLLVWSEQGVGDTLQMARFLARTHDCVGSVTLGCPPGTRELLQTVEGVDDWVDTSATPVR